MDRISGETKTLPEFPVSCTPVNRNGSPQFSPAIRTTFTKSCNPRAQLRVSKARTSTCRLPCSNDAATLRLTPRQPLTLEPGLAAGDARAPERRFPRAAGLARWDE